MKKISLFLTLFLCAISIFAQYTQTIRGTVIESASETTIPGASVVVLGSNPLIGTVSNENGEFRLANVPVGRVSIEISFLGYNTQTLSNLILTSGKELVLNIKLEEKVIQTQEIVVKASRKDQAMNEMAQISARSFTKEETERFAGSMGDPSRMVANYAGVVAQGGAERNDIIIRGNSPMGLLWRIDGISVPNPNHFGSMGTTGGPVSMLNNNLLTNSDFYTGAFPAEYGNALSGAFDIGMRAGNNEKREYVGQIGFGGFEFGAEGPFSKDSKSSYLINFRYSTLEVLEKMGVSVVDNGLPQYKDLSFKLNFPKTPIGKISIFGVGGLSHIDMVDSKSTDTEKFENSIDGGDTYFGSDAGFVGISNTYYFNNDKDRASSLKTVFSISGTKVTVKMDTFGVNQETKLPIKESIFLQFGEKASEIIYGFNTQFRKKFNAKNNLTIGTTFDWYSSNYKDSIYSHPYYRTLVDSKGECGLWQTFAQLQHRFSDKVSLYGGVHFQQFTLNQKMAVEPRASLKWNITPNQSLTFGYGLHSQLQARMVYFRETHIDSLIYVFTPTDTFAYGKPIKYVKLNKDLDFSKSHHFVIGYDNLLSQNFRVKVETYYQYLFNIPITQSISEYSMINSGADYYVEDKDSLVNKGTGLNYGLELTFEKFLSNNYYFLITATLYDSKYKGSDNVERNTAFNSNYIINFLAGYELKTGTNSSLTFDSRATYSGGKRYVPINLAESIRKNERVFDYSKSFENRYPDYFRLDIRIGFKWNSAKFSQEWGFDIQNVLMQKTVSRETYDRVTKTIRRDYQLSFLPMGLWRIQF